MRLSLNVPLFKNISISFDMSAAVEVPELAAPVTSSSVGSTTAILPSTKRMRGRGICDLAKL